jgi:hypothetical protein
VEMRERKRDNLMRVKDKKGKARKGKKNKYS